MKHSLATLSQPCVTVPKLSSPNHWVCQFGKKCIIHVSCTTTVENVRSSWSKQQNRGQTLRKKKWGNKQNHWRSLKVTGSENGLGPTCMSSKKYQPNMVPPWYRYSWIAELIRNPPVDLFYESQHIHPLPRYGSTIVMYLMCLGFTCHAAKLLSDFSCRWRVKKSMQRLLEDNFVPSPATNTYDREFASPRN